LEDLQADHGDLLLLAPVGGQLPGLAEEDVVVDPVVVLDDVQPGVDLPLQVPVAQVAISYVESRTGERMMLSVTSRAN
jgi:hypothetical protein